MSYYHAAKRTKHYNYAIRNIVSEAKKVEASGACVSYLNIGDPPKYGFNPPVEIVKAYQKVLSEKLAEYSPSAGIWEAREAIAEKMTSRKIAVSPENVIITAGASEAADIVYSATLDGQDEVIVPLPVYPLYDALANKVGAKQVYYHLDPNNGWSIDPGEVEKRITPRSKMLLIVNPNNPTGCFVNDSVLLSLLEIARKHKLIVVSDEVYSEMVFDGKHTPVASLAGDDVPVFTLESMSKNFLVPGWRIGWVGITNNHLVSEIRDAMLKLADARLCANTPAQYTVKVAMNLPNDYFTETFKRLRKQRDVTFDMLNAIPGVSCNKPQGAFYAFPRISLHDIGMPSDESFVLDLLKREGILFVHGSGFGMNPSDGFFRIVFLPHEAMLSDIYRRLKTHVLSLRKADAIA